VEDDGRDDGDREHGGPAVGFLALQLVIEAVAFRYFVLVVRLGAQSYAMHGAGGVLDVSLARGVRWLAR
jgi:hypothetical protein